MSNSERLGGLQKGELARLRRENETLRQIVIEFHWQARRYCDGRCTGAPGMFNHHVQALLALGVSLNPTGDETIWARTGAFGLDNGAEMEANVREMTEERLEAGHPVARGEVIPLPLGTHLVRELQDMFADGHDRPYDIIARIKEMKAEVEYLKKETGPIIGQL